MSSEIAISIAAITSVILLVYIIYRLRGNWKGIGREITQLENRRLKKRVFLKILVSIPSILFLLVILISAYILFLDTLHFKGYISAALAYFLGVIPIGIWIFDFIRSLSKK